MSKRKLIDTGTERYVRRDKEGSSREASTFCARSQPIGVMTGNTKPRPARATKVSASTETG